MNHSKYEEQKTKRTDSYVAKQVSALNERIKEQNEMIKNLKSAIVDKSKIIGTLNQEIQTLRVRLTSKNIDDETK